MPTCPGPNDEALVRDALAAAFPPVQVQEAFADAAQQADDEALVSDALVAAFAAPADRPCVHPPVLVQHAFVHGVHEADDDALELVGAVLQAAFPQPTEIEARAAERAADSSQVRPPARARIQQGASAYVDKRSRVRQHGRMGIVTTAVTLAATVSFSGAAAASMSALPGERLYPVKGVVEVAWVAAVAGDDEAEARVQARLAQRRLDEVVSLRSRGADVQVVDDVLADFEDHVARAHDLAPVATAGTLADLQRQRTETPSDVIAAPAPEAPPPTAAAPAAEEPVVTPADKAPQQPVPHPTPSQTTPPTVPSTTAVAPAAEEPVVTPADKAPQQPVPHPTPSQTAPPAGSSPTAVAPAADEPVPLEPAPSETTPPQAPSGTAPTAGGAAGAAAGSDATAGTSPDPIVSPTQGPAPAAPPDPVSGQGGGETAEEVANGARPSDPVDQQPAPPSVAPSPGDGDFDREELAAATMLAEHRAARLAGSPPPLVVRQELQSFLVRLGYEPGLAQKVATDVSGATEYGDSDQAPPASTEP